MITNPQPAHALKLRPGETVEVRTAQEILATLDEKGELDCLPFMPEMLAFCGRRFRVGSRADKACDTIDYRGNRRMFDTVHLQGLRCDGGAHGGCQAACLLYWKEDWLKRVASQEPEIQAETAVIHLHKPPPRDMHEWQHLERFAVRPKAEVGAEVLYQCQATELLRASKPMAWWDPRQYWRDVWTNNVTIGAVVRAALFRCFLKLLGWGVGYRLLLASYNRLQAWRKGTPFPYLSGNLDKTPRETLDLTPGEWVQVKSHQEILQTIDKRRRNRGLSFDPEMVRYCGGTFRVIGRVERLIEEKTGRLLNLPNDCVILGGVYCRAEYSHKRLFCPRSLYTFWREIWLKRVDVDNVGSQQP